MVWEFIKQTQGKHCLLIHHLYHGTGCPLRKVSKAMIYDQDQMQQLYVLVWSFNLMILEVTYSLLWLYYFFYFVCKAIGTAATSWPILWL
jgi:hypothetical protein